MGGIFPAVTFYWLQGLNPQKWAIPPLFFFIFSHFLESLNASGQGIWGKGKENPALEEETLQIHPVHLFLRH